MKTIGQRRGRVGIAVLVIALGSLALQLSPASAFPPGDPVYTFNYSVKASTHLKKLNETIAPPPGTFIGGIDLSTFQLVGNITLPQTSFTLQLAGIVPLVTATAKIVSIKPVVGKLNLANFTVTATATLNIRILSAYATGVPINLVGNSCVTATPVSITMSGPASFGGTSKFSGTFTIPSFKTCGLATTAINQVIPGPGNTFTAIASPA